uniref:Uncharacterized protein n=1 Tax=Cucumis melo TaxID=3656 RepID=A0A9I9EDW7_CUCME
MCEIDIRMGLNEVDFNLFFHHREVKNMIIPKSSPDKNIGKVTSYLNIRTRVFPGSRFISSNRLNCFRNPQFTLSGAPSQSPSPSFSLRIGTTI